MESLVSSKVRAATLVVLLAFVAGIGTQNAFAATQVVGVCRTGAGNFSTIQAAITAANPGDTVKICPNTYAEQVSINKNLSVTGVINGNEDAVIIVPPVGGLTANTTALAHSAGDPIAAQVLVLGPATVSLSNLIVDGKGNGINGCGPNLIGVFYRNASGTATQITARNQALTPALNGCQSGSGIFVESDTTGGTAVVTVQNSSVHGFQKNGIVAREVGATLSALNNDVVGVGPTTGAAQNGIEFAFGAGGIATGNRVSNSVWAGNPNVATASGILLYDTANGVQVKNNIVTDTQYAIQFVTDGSTPAGDSVVVSGNTISDTQFDGIDACTNNNTISNNLITNSGESAIHLDDTCTSADGSSGNGNSVTGNAIAETCVGVLLGNGSGNNVTPGTYATTGNAVLLGDACPSSR